MAKAYGYLEKKKDSYKSSQVKCVLLNADIIVSVLQLVMSSWDLRGFTLEANIDNDKNKSSSSNDTELCTGDQLADSEKVGGGYSDKY